MGTGDKNVNMTPATTAEIKTIPGRLRNGDLVRTVTICSSSGHTATILSYGLRLIHLSSKSGRNIVLPLNNIPSIDNDRLYVGAIVGRTANRVRAGNEGIGRVDSSLVLNELESHHIHGGLIGWSDRLWWLREVHKDWAEFGLICPDGNQGYSGSLEARVKFWIKTGALSVRIWVKNLGPGRAVANPTLHTYFDLSGKEGKSQGEIFKWNLWTDCNRRLALDRKSVPTGDIEDIEGTEFDFRKMKRIEGEYDCFLIVDDSGEKGAEGKVRKVAEVVVEDDGGKLELFTDQPGFQLYTANGFDGTGPKGFCRNCSICMEPSGYLDAANNPHFPSIVLEPEEEKRSNITYRFST